MQNPKSGVIGLVMIATIFLGAGCAKINSETNTSQVDNSKSEANSCYTTFTKAKFGLVDGKPVTMAFEYPCDWTPNTTAQGWVSVTAPDQGASLSWPILDIDIHDLADQGTFTTKINGVDYMGHRYASAAKTAEFLYVPITDGTENNGMVVMYTSEASKAQVYHILSTMKF